MKVGAKRIKEIILSLRNFSRLDESDKKLVDIHEGIDSTLVILQSRLDQLGERIKIIKEYGELPQVECYAGLLNQVFMNILANAIDAIEESLVITHSSSVRDKAKICIRTEVTDDKQVIIRISDNGTGIPESYQNRLFDPFFTTKPVGQGTGLGLSISYQIVVQKHGGQLQCISAFGEGTEFIIKIPAQLNS
ncbi:sensor histidine kinase [Nostoc sp.]|uniref:sensor histidine kinase n=1 Tax=Nostoc sp. TaxID=1180 RepID=UPI003FA552AB